MSVDEPRYQLGIHWPTCIERECPGCMPAFVPIPPTKREYDARQRGLDLSIFRRPDNA